MAGIKWELQDQQWECVNAYGMDTATIKSKFMINTSGDSKADVRVCIYTVYE